MVLTKNALQSQTIRNSGVELLKVLAILAICLNHCTQTMENFADIQASTLNIQLLILRFFRFGGTVGNLVFIISSSYFLFGKKKVRREKAVNILLDSQFISVIILAGFCILSKLLTFHVNYSERLFLRNIFPDLYENVWFIPTYVAFYFIHPVIDSIIDNLDRRKHLAISLLLFALYSFCGLLGLVPLARLSGFIIIYFIVAYLKLYSAEFMSDRKKNVRIFLIFSVVLAVCVLSKNFLGLYLNIFEKYPCYDSTVSFILLPMMISLFNIFLTFDFKSRAVNYLSSCSMFVYCIHENILVRGEIRPKFYEFMIERAGGVNHCLVNVLILFVIVAVTAFAAAIVYKHTLHKLTAKLSVKADRFICKTLYKMTAKLIQEE